MLESIKFFAKRLLLLLACVSVLILIVFIFALFDNDKTYKDGVKSGLYKNIEWGSKPIDVIFGLGIDPEEVQNKYHIIHSVEDYDDMFGVNAEEIAIIDFENGLCDIYIRIKVVNDECYTTDEVFKSLIDDYEKLYGDQYDKDQEYSFWITEESEILIGKSKDEIYIQYYPLDKR